MRGAKSFVIFCNVSEPSLRDFSKPDSNWATRFGTTVVARFWRPLSSRALLEPLWGVPKNRMPYVQRYRECIREDCSETRLAENIKAYSAKQEMSQQVGNFMKAFCARANCMAYTQKRKKIKTRNKSKIRGWLTRFTMIPPREWQMKMMGRSVAFSSYVVWSVTPIRLMQTCI